MPGGHSGLDADEQILGFGFQILGTHFSGQNRLAKLFAKIFLGRFLEEKSLHLSGFRVKKVLPRFFAKTFLKFCQ